MIIGARTRAPAAVAATFPVAVPLTRLGSLAVPAATAIFRSNSRNTLGCDGTENASSNIFAHAAQTTGSLTTLLLLIAPKKLGGADTCNDAFGQMALVVRTFVIRNNLSSFLPNID